MTTVLNFPDGRIDIVFTPEDFAQIVSRHMGYEAGQFVNELIQQTKDAHHRAQGDFRAYESQVEEQRQALLDIQELMQTLPIQSKRQHVETVRQIFGTIAGQI